MPRILLILALLAGGPALLGACAAGEPASEARARTNPNVLSAEEIREYLQTRISASAADIVRQARPSWLSRRGPGGQVWAYEGGIRMGEAGRYLEGVDLNNVARIEYLGANEANLRYGAGHDQGVIQIVYRTR